MTRSCFVGICWLFMSALWAQVVDIDTPPGDKTFGEEELIEARKLWFMEARGLDKVDNPAGLRKQAVEQLADTIRSQDRGDQPEWAPTGPSPMTMLSWSMGNVAGRVSAMDYDPRDVNVIYLGTASGGLWKSTDGGQSWKAIFDKIGTQTIGSVFVQPSNPDIVWVGTGEQGRGCSTYFGMGLFRSTNGGQSFQEMNGTQANPLRLTTVTAVAVHPTNDNIVLAGGQRFCDDGTSETHGLFRSTDGGQNWVELINRATNDIAFNPNSPDVVYAGVGLSTNAAHGVYKSIDGGATWNQLTNGLPTNAQRVRISMAPSAPDTVYALINRSGAGTGLYRTQNGGDSWQLMNSNACGGQCSYNLCIDVHPTDPDTILIGTILVARSTNGGTTLQNITSGWGPGQAVHQDTHVVKFDDTASGDGYWVGSDGGLWGTKNGGTDYDNLNSDLNITQFYDIAVHPNDPRIILGGAQDNSSLATFGMPLWNVTFVSGDGFMNMIDPDDPNVCYQTSYPPFSTRLPSLFRSTSGGSVGSFSRTSSSGLVAGPFQFKTAFDLAKAAGQPTAIFVGSNRVFRSTNRASSWEDISGVLGLNAINVITSRGNDNGTVTVYVGGRDGNIFRCDNALDANPTWVNTNSPLGTTVADIEFQANAPQRVFATRSRFGKDNLYRSLDGGTNWSVIGANLPIAAGGSVAIDPLNPARIFYGCDIGVYVSTDNGDTFVPFMNGLPLGTVVTDLEIDDDPYLLTAGTYGRGAWRIPLSGSALRIRASERLACAGRTVQLDPTVSGGGCTL